MESCAKCRESPLKCHIYAGGCACFCLSERCVLSTSRSLPFDLPAEPNLESGANIDCCKLYRDNKEVRRNLENSRPTKVVRGRTVSLIFIRSMND